MKLFWLSSLILTLWLRETSAFQAPLMCNPRATRTRPSSVTIGAPSSVVPTSSTVLHETWRQYVPLAVSVAVIGDILLGSPLANSVLALARPPPENDEKASKEPTKNSNERVDTQKMANAAIEKAQYTLELRRFLDDTKSDWDKIQDKQREVERQQAIFDQESQK